MIKLVDIIKEIFIDDLYRVIIDHGYINDEDAKYVSVTYYDDESNDYEDISFNDDINVDSLEELGIGTWLIPSLERYDGDDYESYSKYEEFGFNSIEQVENFLKYDLKEKLLN